jgi:hypothetical protein
MDGLKKSQYNMFGVVLEFLANPETQVVTGSIPQIAAFITAFMGKLVVIDELKEKVAQDITGTTKERDEFKKSLALETSKIAKVMHQYATSLPVIDQQLKAKTKFAPSYYFSRGIATIADIAKNVHDLAEKLITVTPPATNPLAPIVDATRLENFLEQITDYKDVVFKPRAAIAERKTDNETLDNLINEGVEMLVDRLDPLMFQFASENPEDGIYKNYKNARALIDPYTFHSGFTGSIKDAITGASLVAIASGKGESVTTKIDAKFDENEDNWVIYTPKYRAFYTLTFEVPGYHTVQIPNKKGKKGKKINIDVVMNPIE